MANGWQFIRSDAAVKFLSICKNAYLVTWLVSELVSVTGKVKPGREVDIKYGERAYPLRSRCCHILWFGAIALEAA
jgi:hypothetical protein